MQTTGRVLDLAISGEGYFVLEDGAGSEFYSRAGNFYFDENRNIVTSSGLKLAGADIIPATAQSFSIGTEQTLWSRPHNTADGTVSPAPLYPSLRSECR